MQHDLLWQLGAVWPPIRERLEGYPDTRRKIEDFVLTQPVEKQQELRAMLLPTTRVVQPGGKSK